MKRLTVIFAIIVLAITGTASPVFRVTKTVRQSDGKTLVVTRTGADHLLYYVTADGIPVYPDVNGDYCYAEFNETGRIVATNILAHEAGERNVAEQAAAQRLSDEFATHVAMRNKTRYGVGSAKLGSVASMGDVKVPVILAEFTDVSFKPENDIEKFSKHFNAVNYTDEGGAGSVRDYFVAQSGGLFRPQFDVVAKVRVSKEREYYGGNSGSDDEDPTGYMAEAIDSATAKGVDFSPYKNAKGEVMVVVIYPGHGEQVSGNDDELWAAYYWGMYHANQSTGIKFTAGLVTDELADYGLGEQFDGIGTFCHEFSHALGLPDFYNTNSASGIFGMDAWSLMDYGQFNNASRTPVGYSAYEREFFGWLKIDTLRNEKQIVTLPPLHGNSQTRAYRILNEADASGNEYYILENRESSDWFLPLYGEGMLVNHVDYSYSAWTNKTINNNRNHQRMTIIPADGILTPLSTKASTYKGDLWPGYTNNTTFGNTTTPCDTAYVGHYMNIRMNNIHRDGFNNIVFYYQCEGQLSTVRNLVIGEVGENGFTARWNTVDKAEAYRVQLCAGDSILRTDTVTATLIAYTELKADTEYTVYVCAIADDWLDSQKAQKTAVVVGLRGDVNCDGIINSADVVGIYNYIISAETSGIKLYNADVNGDSQINSADVVAVYNIIVGKQE